MSGEPNRLVVIGVDGLDFDVVRRLRDTVPTLARIVEEGGPHASVFPPDSVPSWTTIVTGLTPQTHGQLSNVKFFLESASESDVAADLNGFKDLCFWERSAGQDVAVINPFLAYPPWPPAVSGAMISGPPFAEQNAEIADPRGLLSPDVPPRMGGFAKIPTQGELTEFCRDTLRLGQEQFDYAMKQFLARDWDLFFFTSLVIDRVEHYTWRHFERGSGPHSDVIPKAHEQLDRFLDGLIRALAPDQKLVLLSDHGHGPRAHVGVNVHEFLRRRGDFRLGDGTTARKRAIEFAKTTVYSLAPRLGLENAAIRLARRLPAKKKLKSGTFVGSPTQSSVSVPDVAGSNPFGGISIPSDADVERLIGDLMALRYRGEPVFKWIKTAAQVLPGGATTHYPDLLFEMHPKFGPTWNIYGPVFSPVITRKRQSGGHTQRGVYAEFPPSGVKPRDSLEISRRLRELVALIGASDDATS